MYKNRKTSAAHTSWVAQGMSAQQARQSRPRAQSHIPEAGESVHRHLIQESWQRCEDFGLTHGSYPVRGGISKGSLDALLEEHQLLLHTTQKEVLPYYDHILANSKCLVVLADRRGQVLNTWGESLFHERHQHGLEVGNQWSETNNGTNAIGTAIASGQAVQVGRDEHFLRANRFMVGSASPIFNTERDMVGVLDISSDAYLPQDHTLGMVKLMTLTVENRLIYTAFAKEHWLLTFNTNVASLASPWSGLIALDHRGRIISANRRAEIMLASDLALVDIESIFNCQFRELRNQPKGLPIEVNAFGKFHMHVLVSAPTSVPLVAPDFRVQSMVAPRSMEPALASGSSSSGAALSTTSNVSPTSNVAPTSNESVDSSQSENIELPDDVIPISELEHGDERLARMVKQASRIMEKDIPILLHGETGCGKEVFVKTLHYHSSRRAYALVAVNCAAIPSELVESELFGYERGAFTGASNKGSIGLIRKAHRGTLFLDEIGEMPSTVQARLLRVLQERKVTPLGSTDAYPVDIKLVSATNKVLKQEVSCGRFRGDLYYRIAGLNLEIPALRQRKDKLALIRYVHKRLVAQSGEPYLPLSASIQQQLVEHPWPGNVRQLISVLSIALAMADEEVIEDWHLPDDFYDEVVTQPELTSNSIGTYASTNESMVDAASELSRQKYTEARVRRLFKELDGNVSRTAKAAGVSRNTVYKYIRS